MTKQYAVVETESIFKMRYVIPIDDIKNVDSISSKDIEKAQDLSQTYVGDRILDKFVCTEAQILDLFDESHPYLQNLSEAEKLKIINDSFQ